jgi:hypothetical protein
MILKLLFYSFALLLLSSLQIGLLFYDELVLFSSKFSKPKFRFGKIFRDTGFRNPGFECPSFQVVLLRSYPKKFVKMAEKTRSIAEHQNMCQTAVEAGIFFAQIGFSPIESPKSPIKSIQFFFFGNRLRAL